MNNSSNESDFDDNFEVKPITEYDENKINEIVKNNPRRRGFNNIDKNIIFEENQNKISNNEKEKNVENLNEKNSHQDNNDSENNLD